jgi:hypothetical protein
MRRLMPRLVGMIVALGAFGMAGCDADSEPESAATTVAGSPAATAGSDAPPTPECTMASDVEIVVEQVAAIDERSSVASAEDALDALLSSMQKLKDGSRTLRRIDVKALNEGLAEVASAVGSVSRAGSVESAVSSLQGSARDLQAAIEEVEHQFGCRSSDAG